MSKDKQDHIVEPNKKVSSVEWLAENIPDLSKYIPFGVSMELHAKFQQAKAMHKEEVIKFAEDWEKSSLDCKEDLYKETFGGNK